jgi:hypothetical protein
MDDVWDPAPEFERNMTLSHSIKAEVCENNWRRAAHVRRHGRLRAKIRFGARHASTANCSSSG